jgi:hypothetical protein
MDVWMNGWPNGWIDGWMYRLMDGLQDGKFIGWMDVRINERMFHGWMRERTV